MAKSKPFSGGTKFFYTYPVQRLWSQKQDILFLQNPLPRPLCEPWASIHLSQDPHAFLSGERWGLPAPLTCSLTPTLIDLFEAWTESTQHDEQARVRAHSLPWSVISTSDGGTLIDRPFVTQNDMPHADAPIPFSPLFPYPNPHKAHTPKPALEMLPTTYPNMHPAHQSSQFFHPHYAYFEHVRLLKKHPLIQGRSLPRTRDSKIF